MWLSNSCWDKDAPRCGKGSQLSDRNSVASGTIPHGAQITILNRLMKHEISLRKGYGRSSLYDAVVLHFYLWISVRYCSAAYQFAHFGKKIKQVDNNLSGLTWDTSTNTLLAVTNRPAQIIQLDTRGNVITLFPLPNIEDPESISLGWNNNYLIAEERRRKITPVTLSLADRRYRIQSPTLELDVGDKKNDGLEGVAFSKSSGALFVANERKPAVIFKVEGFNIPRHPLRIKNLLVFKRYLRVSME